MSTQEKLELIRSINIKSGQQEPYSQQNERGSGFKLSDRIAGFLQNGKFCWIANDAVLTVVSTDTGVEVAYYNFAKHNGVEGCRINCVEEIKYLPDVCIVAVCIEFLNVATLAQDAGMVSIFCVQGSKILGSMDMSEHITSCKALDWENCRRSALRQFHGALAIGTIQGKLFLVDLMIPNDIREIVLSPSYDGQVFPMVIVPMSDETDQVQLVHQHKKFISSRVNTGEKSYFAIQLKQVLDDSGAIISFLCMPSLIMMAIGLNDGRMILYDLLELQAFHLAYPPGNRSPLTHMSFIEPADDPRSAVYIWAFHSTKDGAIAVMHSVMFENRVNGFYENFRSCSVRLTMPMFVKDTFPVCCRSITKALTSEDEEVVTINLLAWTSPSRKQTHVMIFDLNQWYKEEMPSVGDWRNALKYTVVFEVPNIALDILLHEKSLMPFNSILRPEEHFYPNSLSFDLVMLEARRFTYYVWNGVQNQVLQQFNVVGPKMIIEPSYYFNELLQVAITPQFYDVTFGIASPIELKREFLLSVALEYNFTGFLKKCAWSWADGSYMGKKGSVGVGLSTLTEWIWNRVLTIKDISNTLCQPLFDFSEQRIDCGTQKQLAMCCKQLKNLSELLQIITRDYRRFIPENFQSQIQTQADTVKMASDYQEILQWLLNVGLLPEGHHNRDTEMETEDDFVIVPYPYRAISSHYNTQRSKFVDDDEADTSPRKYLFIDAFIEHECNGEDLIELWEAPYPPKSIQSLLRTLLVPNISTENKHVIFIYLFMDITNALNESSYSTIVRNLIKFPAVFKINPSIIKRTQAFWNLDNGLMDTAVEELISPLSNDRFLPKWQRELLIAALLKQNATSLALRALRCPGNPIATELEMATLLSNNLISEALKTQRASGDRKLLEKFFHKTLHSANYEQLLDLALTENEGVVLRDYLQRTDLSNCVNVHFVYLLQRAKFIDAAQLMDSFNSSGANLNMEPPKQVLNAYYSVMEPTTRKLTSMAYAENSPRVQDSALPLSVNLIHARCNASNDIYKRCVQSITEATHEISQEIKEKPFIGMPKLGMFEQKSQGVQTQEITYPMEFNEHGKRPKNSNGNGIFRMEEIEGPQSKRRRVDEEVKSNQFKSYVDRRINLLTNFKQMRPQMNFTIKTPSSSSRATPEKQAPLLFGDVLNTPIVEKKTPMKIMPERAGTPQSILKTRSCRSSVSPAHSRFSEMDDNKSVKSITFAAMPDTRESSLQDSSYLDESFGGVDQANSSAEIFYSPEKNNEVVPISSSSSIVSGPKPRPPIKSRSNTPQHEFRGEKEESAVAAAAADQLAAEEEIQPFHPSEVRAQSTHKAFEERVEETLVSQQQTDQSNVTIESSSESEDNEVFKRRGVLNSSNEGSESESDVSIPDDSIYGYVRKSVLQTTQVDSSEEDDQQSEPPFRRETLPSSSSEDDLQIAEDEHFEEEELPEHSDYDDDNGVDEEGSDDGIDYGFSSSDDSAPKKKPLQENDEVIELLDSDDDDVQIQVPIALPRFSQVQAPQQHAHILPSFDEIEREELDKFVKQQPSSDVVSSSNQEEEAKDILELVATESVSEPPPPPQSATEAEMMDLLYENLEEQNDGDQMDTDGANEGEDIESPQFEIISTSNVAENQDVQVEADEERDQCEDIREEQSCEIIPQLIQDSEQAKVEESADTQHAEMEPNDARQIQDATPQVSLIVDEPPQEVSEEIVETSENPLEVAQVDIEMTAEEIIEADEAAPEKVAEETIADTEMTENPLECALIENESKGEENSESFVSAASEMQVSSAEKDAQVSETNVEISNFDEDITESENPLEMAVVEDDSKINEQQETDKTEGECTLEENIEEEVTENPLEVAQYEIEEEKSNVESTAMADGKDEDDKEIEDILKTPTAVDPQETPPTDTTQTDPVDLSMTPKRRRSTRSKSEIPDIGKRTTRATSVPSSATSSSSPPPSSRASRASSELHINPKAIIKERMLESISESPRMLTRNKTRLISQSSETTPQTPTRGSRAPSEDTDSVKRTPRRRSSAGTPTMLTPRRILTRAISKESVASSVASSNQLQIDEKTPEEPTTTRRRGKKKTATSDDEGDDVKSTKSGQSTSSSRKNTTPTSSQISPETTSPIDELNVTNRRLTRSQLAVLEKSRVLAERMSHSSTLRQTVSDTAAVAYEEQPDSDNESVKSARSAKSKESKASSRKGGRKRKMPVRFSEDDTTSSVASKSSRKSKSPIKKHQLSMIPEEENEASTLERSTRGRKK